MKTRVASSSPSVNKVSLEKDCKSAKQAYGLSTIWENGQVIVAEIKLNNQRCGLGKGHRPDLHVDVR